MAFDYRYTYFRVSKTDDVLTAAHQYKELRLRALKLSPSSFASTYEIEAAFTDEYWVSRLTKDGRETFICVASSAPESDASNQAGPEWVAQVTFLGPQSKEDFTLPAASGQPNLDSDEEEERWQMLGLFTLSSHRGKGIAKKLCRRALDYLVSYQSHPKNVRVRLMVKPGQHSTLSLYRQLGFIKVGNSTLAEALIANGDRELLPENFGGENYSARTSHIMMQQFSRNEA
ncbi:hypothetical protein V1505DRAFT_381288 [Lipomyces doorenjongii]